MGVNVTRKMEKFERVVFIPDIHAPYIHADAFHTAMAFLRAFDPDVVFVLGDVIDFYQLSRFSKSPTRLTELQYDIDQAVWALKWIRKSAPKAKIYFLKGNHEERLNKFLWTKAAELISLRDLTVPHLLELNQPDINMEYVETGSMMYRGILVKHGNVVRARSGYTATGELEKAWISGVSGHTHRLSQIYKTNFAGMFTWLESGCLCKLDPEYAEGQITDWQHGLSYGHFSVNKVSFEMHTLPIIDKKIRFGGTEIIGEVPKKTK